MTTDSDTNTGGDMTTVTYPSADLPAPPPVSIDVPQAWELASLPGVAIAARQVETNADFTPNVIVRVGTRRALDQPADILMELADSMAGKAGSKISPAATVDVDGLAWTRVEVTWQDGNGVPIHQVHLSAGLPRDEQVQDFIHLTGSVGGAGLESDAPLVEGVLSSVRVAR